MSELEQVDGSQGEGGGQILRSSLALSMITGRPIHVTRIRSGRKKPGLVRQHLTAVKAAARISNAHVEGAELGSNELRFFPQGVNGGHYEFAVGTAGSATLVFQTVLPALMMADAPSTLVLEGGTHNPWAPPYEFLVRSFLPCIEAMGPRVECELERAGFHPAGGGRFEVAIQPTSQLKPLHVRERGAPSGRRAEALVAHLSPDIGKRELKVLSRRLSIPENDGAVRTLDTSTGPGNAIIVTLDFGNVTTVVSTVGEKGVRAERVAHQTADAVERYLQSDAPVGPYLADQLLLPMALCGEGSFRTRTVTLHAKTNIDVIRQFLDTRIETTDGGGSVEVVVV